MRDESTSSALTQAVGCTIRHLRRLRLVIGFRFPLLPTPGLDFRENKTIFPATGSPKIPRAPAISPFNAPSLVDRPAAAEGRRVPAETDASLQARPQARACGRRLVSESVSHYCERVIALIRRKVRVSLKRIVLHVQIAGQPIFWKNWQLSCSTAGASVFTRDVCLLHKTVSGYHQPLCLLFNWSGRKTPFLTTRIWAESPFRLCSER